MSRDVHSYVYVGFEIYPTDLRVTITDEHKTCPNKHVQKGEAKFCDQCGGSFSHGQKHQPTEGLKRLLVALGVEDADPDCIDPYSLTDLGIGVSVNAIASGDGQGTCLAVAEVLEEVNTYQDRRGSVVSANKTKVLLAFSRMEALREAMLGNDPREVQLFVSMTFS